MTERLNNNRAGGGWQSGELELTHVRFLFRVMKMF